MWIGKRGTGEVFSCFEADVERLIQVPSPLPNLRCYGEDFELRMHGFLEVCLQMNPTERFSAKELLTLFERIFEI